MHDLNATRYLAIALLLVTVVAAEASFGKFAPSAADTIARSNARIAAHLARVATGTERDHDVYGMPGYEVLFQAPCATGRLNANEDWVAYRHTVTRAVVYHTKDHSFVLNDPPCVLFQTWIEEMAERERASHDGVVETFDNEVGGYVRIETKPWWGYVHGDVAQ